MTVQGTARHLRIYVDGHDQRHDKALYVVIVEEARTRGLAGATVTRGALGYGFHGSIDEPHDFRLTRGLPVVVEIVDSEEKVEAFLPYLAGLLQEGLITISEVDVIRYDRS